MSGKYLLAEDGKTPQCVDDVLEWAKGFEKLERRVRLTKLGKVEVSTVFLAVDHAFGSSALPVLWETMVFGGPLDEECVRYSSYDEAVKGHRAMVARVKGLKQTD